MVYSGLYTFTDNEYVPLLFSQAIFSNYKSDAYKQLICIMQCVHFEIRVGVSIVKTEIYFVFFLILW